jgi:chromosomal replication initiation ATPase DnaA
MTYLDSSPTLAALHEAAKARKARMSGSIPDDGIVSAPELRRRRIEKWLIEQERRAAQQIEDRRQRENDAMAAAIAAKAQVRVATPARVVRAVVAEHYGVSVLVMMKPKDKSFNRVWQRQVAIYFIRRFSSLSFPQIGQLFGGVDHSSAMHAYRKIETKRMARPEFDADLAIIEGKIREALGIVG